MTLHILSLKNLSIAFLVTTVLISCASSYKITPTIQIITQQEDFTIEGKFKIKINNTIDNGYLVLKKRNNVIFLTLGKNFLLPERELIFDYEDSISLSKLINVEEKNLSYDFFNKRLEIKQLISLLLGKKVMSDEESWNIYYPQGTKNFEGIELPQKIVLTSGDYSIEFILKKFNLT